MSSTIFTTLLLPILHLLISLIISYSGIFIFLPLSINLIIYWQMVGICYFKRCFYIRWYYLLISCTLREEKVGLPSLEHFGGLLREKDSGLNRLMQSWGNIRIFELVFVERVFENFQGWGYWGVFWLSMLETEGVGDPVCVLCLELILCLKRGVEPWLRWVSILCFLLDQFPNRSFIEQQLIRVDAILIMLKTKLPTKLRSKREEREEAKMHQQIKNPQKLKLLVLSGSRLSSNDFTFMLRCKSLIKLDLSDNQLSKLPEFFRLSEFPQLRLVYLHKNNFKTLEDIKPVLECPRLIHLTLHANPIYSNQLEHFVINVLKMLRMVNQRVVYQEERMESVVINKPHVKVNIEKLGMRGFDDEEKGENNKYIEGLDKQIQQIDRLWVNFNPLIKFQRIWRSRRIDNKTRRVIEFDRTARKQIHPVENKQQNVLLKKYFSLWKTFEAGRKKTAQVLHQEDKNHLVYNQKRYLEYRRNQRVNQIVKLFLEKIREKVRRRRAVKVFQKHLMMKTVMFESENSFYAISGIEATHRVIIASNQQSLLENILENVGKMLGKSAHWSLQPCRDYISIRTVDSLRSQDDHNMYRMFVQPSMRCIFLKRKAPFFKNTPLVNIKQLPYIVSNNTELSDKQLTKMKFITNQVSRYAQNQYQNSLLQFTCNDPQYFKMFLRLVYYHNTNSIILEQRKSDLPSGFNFLNPFSNQLIFYFDKQLERTTAAITIQKTWKRYWSSRTSTEIIQEIKRNRAAVLLQHFYRGLEFKHRSNFNKEICKHLQLFDSSEILIHSEVYFRICNLPVSKELCPGTTLWYSRDTVTIKSRNGKSPFNPIVISQFPEPSSGQILAIADNYHLLHVGAEVSQTVISNRKYIKFQYKSIEQTKKRVAYLGLFSYLYKQHGFFIRGLTKQMLVQENYELYQERMERVFQIKLKRSQEMAKTMLVKNPIPYFLFPTNEIDYFQEPQPLQSYHRIHLRIYHYVDQNQQPHQINQNIILSLRYFKEKPETQRLNSQQSSNIPGLTQPISISGCRTNQKLKRLNNTLKNLTAVNHSPLQITKTYQQQHKLRKQKEYMEKKKNDVRIEREKNRNNKLIATEYRKWELGRVKKWGENQKSMVDNSRAQRQEQEEERREKARSSSHSKRERRSSLQEKNEHQMDFVQKGNFLFKQYLKMSIMKDKKSDLEAKRSLISKKASRNPTMSEEKRRRYSILDRSVSLIEQPYETRQGGDSPILNSARSEKDSMIFQQKDRVIQSISKTQQLVNKPRVKKTKEHMVHGVFPQQFYAIEKRNLNLNLPKI